MPYQRPGICVSAMKEAGEYGGHEGSRAVTLSHDEGQRFKFMGQDGGLVCFLCV